MLINQIIAKLCQQHIPHQILSKPAQANLSENWLASAIPPHSLSSITLLQDADGIVIAIHPTANQPSLTKINSLLHRKLSFLTDDQIRDLVKQLFDKNGHELDTLNEQLQVLIDEATTNQDVACFPLPQHRFVRVNSEELEQLPFETFIGSVFSYPKQAARHARQKAMAVMNIREQVKQIQTLPAMPDTARKLLAISNSPNPTLQQLNQTVKQDPALAALIIRYANSAMFGMRGEIRDLNDAIFRVLGFDGTLYLALGMALGKRFTLAEKGMLSRLRFWQSSLYNASLAQKLAMSIPKSYRPHPGLAYLAGLLHDIGYLILAENFDKSYQWLNYYATANESVPLSTIEQLFLGVHHSELGSMLTKNWRLPTEISQAIRYHHDSSYIGPGHVYANLVLLCNRLLKPYELSYGDNEDIPAELCARLHLDEEQIYLIMDEVVQGDETLRGMAGSLSA